PRRAGEVIPAADAGHPGPVELAHGGDERVRLERGTAIERDVPAGRAVVEPRRCDTAPEADAVANPPLRGQLLQEAWGLRVPWKPAAGASWRERERVKVRRHVAGRTGVGVVAPGSAGLVARVDDQEVVDARPLQGKRHADTAESGADDDDPVRQTLGH